MPTKLPRQLQLDLLAAARVPAAAGSDGPGAPMARALRRVAAQKKFVPALAEELGVESESLRQRLVLLADSLERLEEANAPGAEGEAESAGAGAEAAPAKPAAKSKKGSKESSKAPAKPRIAPPKIAKAWTKGEVEAARLHTDGASKGNPGPASGGVVFLSPEGETLCEAAIDFPDMTNNEAEYNALLRGLEMAVEKGLEELDVYMDSELVVKQMTGVYRVKHPRLAPLMVKARRLGARFPGGCRYHAVRRGQNARADELANLAIERRSESGDGE